MKLIFLQNSWPNSSLKFARQGCHVVCLFYHYPAGHSWRLCKAQSWEQEWKKRKKFLAIETSQEWRLEHRKYSVFLRGYCLSCSDSFEILWNMKFHSGHWNIFDRVRKSSLKYVQTPPAVIESSKAKNGISMWYSSRKCILLNSLIFLRV